MVKVPVLRDCHLPSGIDAFQKPSFNYKPRLGLGNVVSEYGQDDTETERPQRFRLHRANLSLDQTREHRFNAFSQSRVAARPPPRVVPGIPLRWEHVAQAAVPLITDDAWPAEVGPPPVELVAYGRIVQIGWSDQILHDGTRSGHPRVQLVSVDVSLRAVTPTSTGKRTTLPPFGSADGQRHGIDDHFHAGL